MIFFKKTEKEKVAILLHLASEINTEIRSRREPEYTYTAAVIGAIGAIVLGVSALAQNYAINYVYSILSAIGLCLIIAMTVTIKIRRENSIYKGLRIEQEILYEQITQDFNIPQVKLPVAFLNKKAREAQRPNDERRKLCYEIDGKGYLNSLCIIWGTTIISTIFFFYLLMN